MAKHNELGKHGEQLAIDFLLKSDYIILERNYRFNKAEVDIIAQKEDTLAVIEVKTRSSMFFGNPEDFVKPKQIKNLVKAVDAFIDAKNLEVEVRFDIISILKNKNTYNLEHIKNAFFHF